MLAVLIRGAVRLAVPAALALVSVQALAQAPGERLFHVSHDTYGCVVPRATLALTNPYEPRLRDPGWVAFVAADGQCAPITPRSPWRLVSLQGELAYMAYAGTTGLPGAFYLRLSDLVEPVPSAAQAMAGPPPAAPAGGGEALDRRPAASPREPPSHGAAPAITGAPEAATPLHPARRVTPDAIHDQPAPQEPAVPGTFGGIYDRPGQGAGAALAAAVVLGCAMRWGRGKGQAAPRRR